MACVKTSKQEEKKHPNDQCTQFLYINLSTSLSHAMASTIHRIVLLLYCSVYARGEKSLFMMGQWMYTRISVDRAGNVLEERGLGFTVCVTC